MLITVSVVVGFKKQIQEKVTGFSAPIQISGEFLSTTYENKPFKDKEGTREIVMGHDYVEHIQAFGQKPGILKTDGSFEGIVIKGYDSSFKRDALQNFLVKGRLLEHQSGAQSREIVISQAVADKLELDTGMSAQVWFVQDPPVIKKVKVVGIYSTEIEELDQYFVLGDLRMVQQVSSWASDEIGGYEVWLKEFDLEKLQRQNNDIRFAIDIDLNSQSILNRFPQIFDWLGLLDKNVQIIILLMTVVAVINMITALLIMILERTQTVGILKSLGYSNMGIEKIFVYNAAYFIFLGLLIGNVVGLGLLFLQDQTQLISLSSDYYITYVPVEFTWVSFLLVNLGTLLLCFVAMFFPAMLVTRIVPVKALRFN